MRVSVSLLIAASLLGCAHQPQWKCVGVTSPDQNAGLVTFEIVPDGDGTRITITHTGLETFGDDPNLGLAPQNFKEGWDYFIGQQLKNFVEQVPVS